MDIIFKCNSCRQDLSIEAAGAGLEVNCPKCNAALIVPSASTESTPLKQTVPLMPFDVPGRPPPPPSAPAAKPPEAPRSHYNLPAASAHRGPPTGPRPPTAPPAAPTGPVRATVTDVDMPLSQMMIVTLKWAVAALPAFTLLFLLGVLLHKLLTALLN